MADTKLIEARDFKHSFFYFTDVGPFGKEINNPFHRESWVNSSVNESNVTLDDRRFRENTFTLTDQFHNSQLNANTGQGNPDDAFGFYFLSRKVLLSTLAIPFAQPIGLYWRAQVRIEALNLSTMVEAVCGWGEQGNIAFDRAPSIAFVASGTGNWIARVQTDDSGSPVTDDFDTGLDTTTSRLLEIVVRPGETRFYMDDVLVRVSTLLYPTSNAAAKVDSYERRPGFFIGGDNANIVSLRFAYWTARSFPLTEDLA